MSLIAEVPEKCFHERVLRSLVEVAPRLFKKDRGQERHRHGCSMCAPFVGFGMCLGVELMVVLLAVLLEVAIRVEVELQVVVDHLSLVVYHPPP